MDDALDQDLERMSGDPRIARAVKDSLRRLTNGAAGPDLAEMARDLLDGRIDLRTVAQSSAYSEPMSAAVAKYDEWAQSVDPEERDRLVAETRAALMDSEADQPGPS